MEATVQPNVKDQFNFDFESQAQEIMDLILDNRNLTTGQMNSLYTSVISKLELITKINDKEMLTRIWRRSVFTAEKSTGWRDAISQISLILWEVHLKCQ